MRSFVFLSGLFFVLVCGASACGGESEGDGAGGASGSGGSSASGGSATGGGAGSDAGAICLLPQDPGSCKAMVPAWWFNAATGKCEYFSYGGCDGNANNFPTPDACVKACAPGTSNGCTIIVCDTGTSCVYAGNGALPSCLAPCGDGGACPTGQSCGCAGSCPGCENCIQVCS